MGNLGFVFQCTLKKMCECCLQFWFVAVRHSTRLLLSVRVSEHILWKSTIWTSFTILNQQQSRLAGSTDRGSVCYDPLVTTGGFSHLCEVNPWITTWTNVSIDHLSTFTSVVTSCVILFTVIEDIARGSSNDCGGMDKRGKLFGFWRCRNGGSPWCEIDLRV